MEYYIMNLSEGLLMIGPLDWKEAVYRQALVRMSRGECAIFRRKSVDFSYAGGVTTYYEMVVDWHGREVE